MAAWSCAQDMQRHSPPVLVPAYRVAKSPYLTVTVAPSEYLLAIGHRLASLLASVGLSGGRSQAEKPQVALFFETVLARIRPTPPLVPASVHLFPFLVTKIFASSAKGLALRTCQCGLFISTQIHFTFFIPFLSARRSYSHP